MRINDLVFYHGTSSVFGEELDKDGLLPSIETGIHNEPPRGYDPECVYLGTPSQAMDCGWLAVEKHGGELVLYEITLDEDDVDNLKPDSDSREFTWEESYAAIGTLAHWGSIEKIKIRKLEEGKDW